MENIYEKLDDMVYEWAVGIPIGTNSNVADSILLQKHTVPCCFTILVSRVETCLAQENKDPSSSFIEMSSCLPFYALRFYIRFSANT